MLINKRFLQLVAAGLLLLIPAGLFAALLKVGGTAQQGAIDTLTVEDNAAFGKAAANMGRIIFNSNPLASAEATRNRVVAEGVLQLDCKLFRIRRVNVDQFQINATGGRTIPIVRLNGVVLTNGGAADSSKAGQAFSRNDAGEPPPLPPCGPVPSLSFYGLVVLALALAGIVVWMVRRRMTPKGSSV